MRHPSVARLPRFPRFNRGMDRRNDQETTTRISATISNATGDLRQCLVMRVCFDDRIVRRLPDFNSGER